MVARRVGPKTHKQDDREPLGPARRTARAGGPWSVAVTNGSSSNEGQWWWAGSGSGSGSSCSRFRRK